jgi:hypothetical protein
VWFEQAVRAMALISMASLFLSFIGTPIKLWCVAFKKLALENDPKQGSQALPELRGRHAHNINQKHRANL